ncbi:MAG: flavin reductase family protein [Rhodospirillales bacterium]|nr:flavin reductase family protein [Rhodospirillales bacterium]MBO6785595.1 flavin reductase family protein [Rhodospirillales bacterium]
MFWKTDEPHGLPRDPFKSCVIPRPIGWISTIGADGVANLAPYSFFNGVSGDPPMVMFASGARSPDAPKDSIHNTEQTGEFVCSMVSYELKDTMNDTSVAYDAGVDEAAHLGIEMEPSALVKPMRVKAAPIHLECTYFGTMDLPADRNGAGNAICVGRVVGVHIRDEFLKDGFVDVEKIRPVARLGYMDYTSVQEVFTIMRPEVKSAAE